MKIIYIAGPYMGRTHDYRSYSEIEANILEARKAAVWLVEHGYGFVCPHLNSAHFEVITPDVPVAFWRELGCRLLQPCDGLLLIRRWQTSDGTLGEKDEALAWGIPVFRSKAELLRRMPPNGGP